MFLTTISVILRIFSNPIANMFEKRISSEGSSLYTSFYSYFFMSLFCIPFVFLFDWSAVPSEFWFYTALAGALCALGRVYMVRALSLGELSVLGPINSYKAIVGLIIAFFMLGEVPELLGIFGMLLIIFGSFFIFETIGEKFSYKFLFRQDILLRFAALILTGIEAVILKKIIIISSVMMSFIMWCFMGCLFTLLIIIIAGRKFVPIKKSQIGGYFAICSGLIVMQITTNYVFKNMNVGYALSLFQLSTIVTLFFGFKFFKEKNIVKKLIGSLIMIAGSSIIILS